MKKGKVANDHDGFKKLPFRIILKICGEYFLTEIVEECNDILDYFGRFKADKTRTIFPIFRSFELIRYWLENPFKSLKMTIPLSTISVNMSTTHSNCITINFIKKCGSLKSIVGITLFEGNNLEEVFFCLEKKQLKTLGLSILNTNNLKSILKYPDIFKKMKKLNISLKSNLKLSIKMNNLKILKAEGFVFVINNKMFPVLEKLELILINLNEKDIVEGIITLSTLKHLNIKFCSFYNKIYDLSNLKKLEKLDLSANYNEFNFFGLRKECKICKCFYVL